jgi:MFS family permease
VFVEALLVVTAPALLLALLPHMQLTGPVIGPVMGGAISEAFGWRATFVFLAIFCGVLGILLLLFLPETHQFYTVSRLAAKDPARVEQIAEAPKILAMNPVFHLPWKVVSYFYTPDFAPYVLINAWSNAALYAGLTLWPVFLAAPPYNLGQAMVGVTYLADGAAAVSGSLLGGIASDKGAARWSQGHEGRLAWNVVVAVVFMPAGFLLFGWGFSVHMHIAGLLVASFLISFGAAGLMPGVYSYVSCVDQANSGSATAAVNAAWCMLAGVIVVVSVPGVSSLGVGGYFTMLACLQVVLSAFAGWCIIRKLRLPPAAPSSAPA